MCNHNWELWTLDHTPSELKFRFGAVMHAVDKCKKCGSKRPRTIVLGEVVNENSKAGRSCNRTVG